MHRFAYDLQIDGTAASLACTYVQKQYEYHRGGVVCKAEPGDVAIDSGACWGETTVYFAHEVGPQGRVLSFEFIPTNLAVLRRNLEAKPPARRTHRRRREPPLVDVGPHALLRRLGPGQPREPRPVALPRRRPLLDGVDRRRRQHAPGAARRLRQDGHRGSELYALKGAERTLRAHRPKLAISLYHQLSDFVTIPRYLESLGLGYSYYLDHHTIYLNKTVLFAVPR